MLVMSLKRPCRKFRQAIWPEKERQRVNSFLPSEGMLYCSIRYLHSRGCLSMRIYCPLSALMVSVLSRLNS